LFYLLLSSLSFVWVCRSLLRLPDRTLYRVVPPWSWLMGVGQGPSLLLVPWTILALGPARSTGIAQARALLQGREPPPEPEAQGPPANEEGHLVIKGPFQYSRHPSNLAAPLVILLCPHMTVNRAVLLAMMTLYSVVGSLHEESRMKAVHGSAYQEYRSKVPFLLPRLRYGTPYPGR
jgi:methanethiol S-methyltransferase